MAVQRITAPLVNAKLDKHLTKHEEICDPMLKNHDIILFGERGNDGMSYDVREIIKGFKTIKGVGYALLIAIATDIITRIMNIVP